MSLVLRTSALELVWEHAAPEHLLNEQGSCRALPTPPASHSWLILLLFPSLPGVLLLLLLFPSCWSPVVLPPSPPPCKGAAMLTDVETFAHSARVAWQGT